MKIIKPLRMIAFVLVLLTSIPLVIHFFSGGEARQAFITHLHVYSGILLLIVAPLTVFFERRAMDKAKGK